MRATLLLLALVWAPPAGAWQRDAGTAAAQFLSLGAGGRSLGMGEAYSAVADGSEAAYWNPAGLSRMTRPDLQYARSELPAGLHEDFLALGLPSRLLQGTLALAVSRLSQERLDLVTNSNQTVGSFSPHSEVYALAYGRGLEATGLSAGLALKLVSEDLGTQQATTFAADAGVQLRPAGLPALTLAGALRDLGGRLRFISASEPLPGELALAAAYEARLPADWQLLPALEVALPYAGSPYGKLGLEASRAVSPGVRAALRVGYTSRMASDLGPLAGLTAGVGLRVSRFAFDAAFQPMALLGESFRLGVGWRF